MRTLLAFAALLALTSTAAVAADAPPPKDAQPLSKILQQVENRSDFAYMDEVEWDHGVYEVEYYTTSGAEVEIKIDPVTGKQVRPQQ